MRVLMIGLGGIGQRHLRNLRNLIGGELEVLACRRRRQQTVLTDKLQVEADANLEEKYGLKVFEDLGEALSHKPQAALICNPSSMHMEAALAAAAAGCHLLIEKPLSHNLERVEELAALLDSKKRVGLVAYQMRFHPCYRQVRKLLADRKIGRVLSARAEVGEYLPGWHAYEDYRQMYASRKELGGGVVLSQIHELDYLYSFFGLPCSVYARGGQLSSLEIDVEDVASILMEFAVEGARIPVHLHQDYLQQPPSRHLQVIGDSGKIMADFRNLTVICYGKEGKVVEEFNCEGLERNQLYLDELGHFLDCIQGKAEPVVTVRQGSDSLRMALASKQSMETGLPVRVP